jgi:hypothetical protein
MIWWQAIWPVGSIELLNHIAASSSSKKHPSKTSRSPTGREGRESKFRPLIMWRGLRICILENRPATANAT